MEMAIICYLNVFFVFALSETHGYEQAVAL